MIMQIKSEQELLDKLELQISKIEKFIIRKIIRLKDSAKFLPKATLSKQLADLMQCNVV